MAYENLLLFFDFHLKVGIEKYEMWIHNKLGKQCARIVEYIAGTLVAKVFVPDK